MNLLRSVSLLAFASAALSASAAPVDVSYTVTGTAGAYELNFTFANNVGNPQLDLYFFGVDLSSIAGTPSGYQVYAGGYNPRRDGGPDKLYASTWLADGFYNPNLNLGVADGASQGGFVIRTTSLTAPTAVDWFVYGITRNSSNAYADGAFTRPGEEYAGFAGTATSSAPAVPAPLAALPFALIALRRRKRA